MSRTVIVTFLIVSIGVFGQLAFGHPELPAGRQWKQSIERPTKGWDYDGDRILGHIDHDICLWDATTGQLVHRMKEHNEAIQKVQFSPDGKIALSSSWISQGPMTDLRSKDTRTILWNLATGRSERILPGQVAGEFSADGTRIIAFSQRLGTSSSFEAAVWEVLTGLELVKVTLEDGSGPYFDALHFSPDASRFVLVDTHETVLYDSCDGHQIGRVSVKHGIRRYTSAGTMACFDLGRDSGTVSLIDIESGRSLQSFEHGVKGVWRGAWSHDGSKIAACPIDGAIMIWDVKSGTSITCAQGGHYPQHVAIISPDNSRLAIMWGPSVDNKKEDDSGFGLYDLNSGAEIAVIGLARSGQLIGFSPDSKTILVSGPNFEIYNSVDGKRIRSLPLESATSP